MANTSSSNRGDSRTTGAAKEHMEEAKGHLQQAGTHAKEAASSAASSVGQKAQDTASDLTQKAKDAVSSATQRAQEFASDVGERAQDKADDALSAMGGRMSSMASSLRQSAPREGMLGSAASSVAETLESGGRYFQQHGVSDIADDLASTIRRHPWPALGLAFGIGILLGMSSRR